MKRAFLVAALAWALTGAKAQAYEKDTHYGLTYYLARQAGYIPQNAHAVADAAWSVDVNTSTEPAREALWGARFIPFIGALSVVVKTKAFRPEQVKVLRSFHGFPDTLPSGCTSFDNLANVQKMKDDPQIAERVAMLRDQGRSELKNPGVFLHYFEDIYSHAGFSCNNGAGHAEALHLPDYSGWKANIADGMARDTLGELKDFLTASGLGVPCDGDPEQVRRMVRRLADANKPSADALATLPWWFIAALGDAATGAGPEWEVAKPELDRGLPPGEHVPEFGMKRLTVVDAPGGYFNAMDLTSSAGMRLQDQNGAVFLVNDVWRTDAPSPKRVRFDVDGSTPDRNAVVFTADHEWTFDGYFPGVGEWHFVRKPAADELPKTAPPAFGSRDPKDWDWATQQVRDQLRLHLVIRLEPHTCRLKGAYYRGLWRFQKGSAGERRAWVPEGIEGWGKGEDVGYVRDFPQAP